MPSRAELVQAFEDTMRRVQSDSRLQARTQCMTEGTRLYPSGYRAADPAIRRAMPDIRVTEDTTFHCAAGLSGKVAVLNFANAYRPGGGVVNGAMAQEECLCRSSNLYCALTLPWLMEKYYGWNAQNTGDLGTDALIYSPGVTVFKTDDALPQPMDDWFQVDVITCAAPYYDVRKADPVKPEVLERVFDSRIRNILEAAAANGVERLVLGAFGCGAFNNPPDLVARAFRRQLVEKGLGRYFDEVLFAIKRNNAANSNLIAFQKVFGGDQAR